MKSGQRLQLLARTAGSIFYPCRTMWLWRASNNANQDLNGSWFIDRNAYDTLKDLRGFDALGDDEEFIAISL